MIARVLPILLLLAAAPAPETDPFLAALAGKSGPDAVAAPSFDPDVEAASWTTRPRREIVDALAARLLRGEAKGWWEPAKEPPALPPPPSRIPADFQAGKFEVTDRLAGRVPADAAAVFFGSLEEAEKAMDELAKFLPKALPVPFADAPGGRRDALALAVDELLLPTIWRSNPNVRRGTRQAALLASDPDLRWAPEIALVVEVDDASLVRFHRLSTLSFEDRGRRHLRIDGLDAVSDDGSVRSFFGLEGGIAVWSTGKAFRDRILAAAGGKAPTLLSPDPRAYTLARATFPAAESGPLLVIPDAFLERANSAAVRGRRTSSLRCDAVRMVLAARALSKVKEPPGVRLDCPSGGTILVPAGASSAICSIHGDSLHRVPGGDLPGAGPSSAVVEEDRVMTGSFPLAAAWRRGALDVLVASGPAGTGLLNIILPPAGHSWRYGRERVLAERLDRIHGSGCPEEESSAAYERAFGESPCSDAGRKFTWVGGKSNIEGPVHIEFLYGPDGGFQDRPNRGVLRIGLPEQSGMSGSSSGVTLRLTLPLEWR